MPERDVTFDVVARDKTSPAVRSAAGSYDHLGDKADKAQRKLDDLGDKSGSLARKLLEARAAASLLARELDKTGDSKLLKDFERASREAGRLARAVRAIEPPKIDDKKGTDGTFSRLVASAKKAGLLAGDAVVEGMGDVFKAIPGPVKGALVGGLVTAVVAAAPAMASAVYGALLVGVAGGGLAAGLALAAKDPAVRVAYAGLGRGISTDLQDAAKPFTGELLGTAPRLAEAFGRELPRVRSLLAGLSTVVSPLVTGLVGMVHNLLPGLQAAASTGGEILRNVAGALPALGKAGGRLFESIAANGPAANAAIMEVIRDITLLIDTMAFAARASAPILNALALMGDAIGIADAGSGKIGVLSGTLDKGGHQAGLTTQEYHKLGNALGNTADQADALNASFNSLFGAQMSVDQANLAVNVGMSQLRETIKGNKKSLDESTTAGQENVGAIFSQIQALDQKRQADIAAGNGTQEASAAANAAYASNVASLRNVLVQLGLAPAAVDALIAKYRQIPQNLTTTITTVFRTVGSQSGISDQATGHSRTGTNDYGAGSSWAPARYADGHRAQMAGDGGGGTWRTGGPTQVHSEVGVTVLLDGSPFRAMTLTAVSAAERRQAWRAKVGKR